MTRKTGQYPSDLPDPAPENKAAVAEEPGVGTQAAAPDPMVQLKADLAAIKSESEQWRDRYLRKAAELENFRKRCDRERAEAAALIKSSVLAEFLPVMDACERALKSFNNEESKPHVRVQKYREGVELLYKQLGDTMSRLGVVALEAKGHKFDPHLHEALTHQETLEYEDDTVIQELRRGYLFEDRLLRPAQVVVASSPKPKKNDGPAQE
jgi:molecular chaperone GrpE